ncbi:MAG: outer membrane protein assembly factor BamC [Burkholderiales bacterium]|nr:outer membrane protein assembly factor BamC [Burkholderiales bacterium]
MKSAVAILSLVVLCTGCSSVNEILESRKVDYKSTSRLPPLEIPPDLTRPATDERFVVPDVTPSGSATYSAYSKDRSGRPAASNPELLPKVDKAHIERAGTQRWLVVDGAPAELWPTVKAFWQELGFVVNVEVPEAGVMETDWAENRAKIDDGMIRNFLGKVLGSISSTSERDKFRTRLERGSGGASTEIYISHRGMIEVLEGSGDKTMWQPRPADPDLEAEMLGRLMIRFGVQEARAKAELQQASITPRARITRMKDGGGQLAIDDQFDRAWRRVGLALDRVGFTVEDRDRSKGLYFVRYVDPDADARSKQATGLLSKLAFWRSTPDPKDRNAQYRIAVKDGNGSAGSEVNVLNKDGQLDRSETANRILSLLYEQLK